MRALALALISCLILAVPTAAAVPAELSQELPEGPIDGNSTVPVTVRLRIGEFMCHDPTTLQVQLSTVSSDGIKALFESSAASFPVEARSYFSGPYEGVAVVNLTVRALNAGQVDLTATFAPADSGPCFVPGGFEPVTITVTRAVVLSSFSSGAPPPPPQGEPPASGEPAEPAEPAGNGAPEPARPTGCAPDKTCGAIGEYNAPAESSEQGTPGLAIPMLIAAIIGVALVARRRS